MTSIPLTVALTISSIFGLIINSYVIIIVILTKQQNSANNILLLHLGCAHLLLGAIYLGFAALNFLTNDNWLADGTFCIVQGFLFTFLHPLTLWTICGLNCDRFYAISSPLHYDHIVNPKKVLLGLGTIWIISLFVCIPPFLGTAPYRYIKELGTCIPDFSQGLGVIWFSIFYTFLTLILPAILITCCNLKILTIARYHRHRIASAIYEVTLSAQVTITHQRNPFFVPTVTVASPHGHKIRNYSAIASILQILLSFAILYLPYYIVIIWNASLGMHSHLMTIACSLLTCSPFVNGFLYGVRNKVLRKAFQNYWRKVAMKNELKLEIQARTPSNCGSRRPSTSQSCTAPTASKPLLERRLSDVGPEDHTDQTIRRVSSELAWKVTFSEEDDTNLDVNKEMQSFSPSVSSNTLQVPLLKNNEDEMQHHKRNNSNELVFSFPDKFNSANFLMNKLFGLESFELPIKKFNTTEFSNNYGQENRSPKITITKANSEESDVTTSSLGVMSKKSPDSKQCSSDMLLMDARWHRLKSKSEETLTESIRKKLVFPLIERPLPKKQCEFLKVS